MSLLTIEDGVFEVKATAGDTVSSRSRTHSLRAPALHDLSTPRSELPSLITGVSVCSMCVLFVGVRFSAASWW